MQVESSMSSDRQRRIREHLAKSSGGKVDFPRLPQNYNSESKDTLLSKSQKSRKEHLERSLGNYNLNSGDKQTQKSRIMEHIRLTRG